MFNNAGNRGVYFKDNRFYEFLFDYIRGKE